MRRFKEITINGLYLYRILLLPIYLIILTLYEDCSLYGHKAEIVCRLYEWIDNI